MCRQRCADGAWFLAWALASSAWCLTAAWQLGPTFDEPVYLQRGLEGWRSFSHSGLLQLGTMPLPADLQTLPLYLWEVAHGSPIDTLNDVDSVLFWMRAGNLVFWWLLLWYGFQLGRLLAGSWGGRLAVALLACEPNLLAHAALATTDIAVTTCLLALLFHFRVGREAGWGKRLAIPAIWFGLAILAKASAIVYGPICLVTVELERLISSGALASPPGNSWKQRLANAWRQVQPARRDLTWIGGGGLAVAVVYCGSDFLPQPSFVEWANTLPDGLVGNGMVWLAEHLCIFSNALEGIVRQMKHNMHGHGAYLLGHAYPRALWYYFPVLLAIKLSVPVLLTPLAIAAIRARALANWACLTALVLLAFSLTFRVQIGIRLILPLVAIGLIGLAAAFVESLRSAKWQWMRPPLVGFGAVGLLWMMLVAGSVWPHGLCYINALWGGTARGYELVSDSNYDWGQGVPELLAWQRQSGSAVDVWYFGRDLKCYKPPLRGVHLQNLSIEGPDDIVRNLQGRYLAASMTLVYGNAAAASHRNAAAFLRSCRPAARTTTFLIFERQALLDESAHFVCK
jgi:Dolichyl-phosphate-mannose-protein mannosyltransferase